MNNGMWANPNLSLYGPFMPFSPYPTAPQGKQEGKHKKEGTNSADGFYHSAGNEKEEKNSGFKNFLLGMKDGVVDTVKGMFTLKGAAITLGTIFAAWATGGAILIPLAIGGMGIGGYQIIKGIVNHDANKSGRGVDTFLLSLLGLKCAPSEFGGHALIDERFGGLWGKLKAPFKFNGEFDPNSNVDFWRAGWDSTKEVFQKLGKSFEDKRTGTAPSPGNATPAETVEETTGPQQTNTNNGTTETKKSGSGTQRIREFFRRKPKESADPAQTPAETPVYEPASRGSSAASSAPGSRPATPKTTTPRNSAATSRTSSVNSSQSGSRYDTPRTSNTRTSSANSSPSGSQYGTPRTSRSQTSSTTNSSRRNTATSTPGSETSNSASSSNRTLTPENLEEFNRRLRRSSRYRRRNEEIPTPEPSTPASGTMSPASEFDLEDGTESEFSDHSDHQEPELPPANPPATQQQKTNPSFSRATWEYIKAKKGGHTQNALNGLYMGSVLSSPTVKATEAQDETETEASAMPGFPPFPYAPVFPPFP